MHVPLDLGYLSQDDIFKFHPFAWKIHDVFDSDSAMQII